MLTLTFYSSYYEFEQAISREETSINIIMFFSSLSWKLESELIALTFYSCFFP